ncbi:DUF3857 domain-containing protein [Carboxylicivirga sp. RSCT41]|uniref:DUF3857 domain-containing protein n=1 Tax=Carboxylicivirga agarovorans TaxID=3417570 RepID=UPI003D32E7B2
MRLSLILYLLLTTMVSVCAQVPDCQVNNYHRQVILRNNKIVKLTEIELQINSAKGTDYAEIEIPYTKGNNIKELEAGIYDLFGKKIRSLKNKDILRSNVFSYASFHSDDMKLSFEMIHNRYPYIVKYSYEEDTNEYLYIANWYPRWYKKAPVKNASLTVNLPVDFPIRLIQYGLDSAVIKRNQDAYIYNWTAKDVEYVKRQKYGPKYIELQPHVVIIPEHFKYGVKGSSKSWVDFGKWSSDLKENTDYLTDDEKQKVMELTKDCISDVEKINVLYKYMQDNTRYINVSLDIGGLKPETGAYVCKNKYGDCKALTNYMYTMLKEAGIRSIYTKVYADRYPVPVNKEFPSQQFNHVILCVPQPNDTIWLECTDNTAPFNYLGSFTQNRTVLLVDGNESKLTRTPALKLTDVASNYSTKVTINKDGEQKMSSVAVIKGPVFDYLKGVNDALPQREKMDYLDELELFEQADISDFNINRTDRDSTYLTLEINAALNNNVEPIGSRALIKPLRSFYFKLEKPEKRTQELRFAYPFNVTDTIQYTLPRMIKSVAGIQNELIESDYGHYKREVSFEGNELMIIRHIIIQSGVYQLSEYAGLYAFIRDCRNKELQKGMVNYQ